jgi:hypothetical protein
MFDGGFTAKLTKEVRASWLLCVGRIDDDGHGPKSGTAADAV